MLLLRSFQRCRLSARRMTVRISAASVSSVKECRRLDGNVDQLQPASPELALRQRRTSPRPTSTGQSQSAGAAKPAYPPAAPVPTQPAPGGVRFDFNEGCRVRPAGRRAAVAGAALRPRHRQHPVRDRAQGRPRQQHQALLRALPHRGLAARARASSPTSIRPTGSEVLIQFSGRHARRHARLVSLCREVPASSTTAG